MFRTETIGNGVTLYLGDSREIVPTLGRVSAVVTDPPYGIEGGSGKISKERAKGDYGTDFDDTPEYIRSVAVPIIEQSIGVADRLVMTPGQKNMWAYPKPDGVGCFYYPAAAGMSPWGYNVWQPIFFYGKDPRAGKLGVHNGRWSTEPGDKTIPHPCPKPIGDWTWLTERASKPSEIILDPFMGSGTTGVAAVSLGRQFIGIELSESFFDVACRRIEKAMQQQDFFIEKPKPAKQEALL